MNNLDVDNTEFLLPGGSPTELRGYLTKTKPSSFKKSTSATKKNSFFDNTPLGRKIQQKPSPKNIAHISPFSQQQSSSSSQVQPTSRRRFFKSPFLGAGRPEFQSSPNISEPPQSAPPIRNSNASANSYQTSRPTPVMGMKQKKFFKSAENLDNNENAGKHSNQVDQSINRAISSKSQRRSSSAPRFGKAPSSINVPVKISIRIKPSDFLTENSPMIDESMKSGPIESLPNGNLFLTSTEGVKHKFNFEQVFHERPDCKEECQKIVYNKVGHDLVKSLIDGFNCCIMAYGATGSGKTFSTMGDSNVPGLINRFCRDFMQAYECNKDQATFIIKVSYYEIYNETIFDLLNSGKKTLKVREDPETGPFVEGLENVVVSSYDDIMKWLSIGNKRRTTLATAKNLESSRSHAIFTLKVDQKRHDMSDFSYFRSSTVCFVDLAGSEKTDNSSSLQETCSINKSLSFLNRVILQLGDKRNQFVNYRDSTLTWLLKEFLGGNSQTRILVTVKAELDSVEETLSTLRFASQAKSVVCRAGVNEDLTAVMARTYRTEIERLNKEVAYYKQLMAENRHQSITDAPNEELNQLSTLEDHQTHSNHQSSSNMIVPKMEVDSELQDQDEEAGPDLVFDSNLTMSDWLRSIGILRADNLSLKLFEFHLILLTGTQSGFETMIYRFDEKRKTYLVGLDRFSDILIISNERDSVFGFKIEKFESGLKITESLTETLTFNNGPKVALGVVLENGDVIDINSDYFLKVWVPKTTADYVNYPYEFMMAKNRVENSEKQKLEKKIDELERKLQSKMEDEKVADKLKKVNQTKLALEKALERASTSSINNNKASTSSGILGKHKLHFVQNQEVQTTDNSLKSSTLFDQVNELYKKYGPQEMSRRKSMRRSTSLMISTRVRAANAYLSAWPKQFDFFQEEFIDDNTKEKTSLVRLVNTKLKIFTMLSLIEFENRLDAIRALYEAGSLTGENLESHLMNPHDHWQPLSDGGEDLYSIALINSLRKKMFPNNGN